MPKDENPFEGMPPVQASAALPPPPKVVHVNVFDVSEQAPKPDLMAEGRHPAQQKPKTVVSSSAVVQAIENMQKALLDKLEEIRAELQALGGRGGGNW